ncbi:MAG: hypothetical protein E7065_09660 [Lentimicrobiaceae bacterium]|nr:hypothetical protein [Lentimicrobiaceae bacterium]
MNLIASILIIFIFLIAVLYRFNRAKIIGRKGERRVSFRLHLLSDEYQLLVERKGKYGIFLGCSNYSKCTFTIKK